MSKKNQLLIETIAYLMLERMHMGNHPDVVPDEFEVEWGSLRDEMGKEPPENKAVKTLVLKLYEDREQEFEKAELDRAKQIVASSKKRKK